MKQRSMQKISAVVGVDVGDRYSQVCVLDPDSGEVLEEGRIRTRHTAFRQRFQGGGQLRVALEVGTHSPWIGRLLTGLGHEVYVANARKLRLIYENRAKDDRVDAEYLARLARVDPRLLAPVRHRGAQAQADLAMVRSRASLVATRTQLINHCRGAVKSMGSRLPGCSAPAFAARAVPVLPAELGSALGPVIEVIDDLTQRIRDLDRQLAALATTRYPETELLRQVDGVGPLTALSYVLTIEDPHRFAKSRSVGAYLGLVPARAQSGQREPQMRVTKEGDAYLRTLLLQCAHYILGPFGKPSELRTQGKRLMAQGGKAGKKRAAVAVARKLAVLLHRLWVTGGTYQPERASRRAA